jgi:hypothetical protein
MLKYLPKYRHLFLSEENVRAHMNDTRMNFEDFFFK